MSILSPIRFPASYQESRAYFQEQLNIIRKAWPSAALDRYFISEKEDLSIDWIFAEPINKKQKLILITTGLHGVEGFVGAAMLDLFIKEYLPSLDPETSGLLFVHALNPWGMANLRRVNRNNVDLNRNFMDRQQDFQVDFNPSYKALDQMLNPNHSLKPFWAEDLNFFKNVIVSLSGSGIRSLRGAVLLGQKSNPAGLYYCGNEYQPETLITKKLINRAFSSSKTVLHIDMHTGYGPRYQMTVVNSPAEVRKTDQLNQEFQYPLILQADPEQFYSMQGDLINWEYKLRKNNYPDVKYYGAAFEFGCYGDGIIKEIKSLRTMIYENQAIHHGSTSTEIKQRIKEEIREMYFPGSGRWREKALSDCRQALSGILSAEGYI